MLFTTALVLMFCLSISIAYADSVKTGTVTATTLNLRSGANADSALIVTLSQGASLTILKAEGNWYQVKTAAGTTGWVSAEYVSTTTTGTVTASTLNLRSGASTDSELIVTLSQGASLTVLKAEGTWYQVKTAAGTTGWVSAEFVSTTTAAPAAAKTATGTITATTLNLRDSASTDGGVIVTLNQGAALTILKAEGNWYQVKTSAGTTGWVSSNYVATSGSAAISRGNVDRTQGSGLASEIVSYAKKFLGVKYVWGGSSPSGFDCSGFVYYVFGHFNIDLDRSSASMASNGTAVSRADLQPGDLVFFDTNGGLNQINHVGIYIGDGEFIQSSSSNSAKKVIISTLASGFYKESFMRARRVF